MAYETTPLWAAGTADRFTAKLREVCRRSAGKIPARAIDGVHDNKADGRAYNPDDGLCWWTNGFWAGMLWRLCQDRRSRLCRGRPLYRGAAGRLLHNRLLRPAP